MKLPAYSPDFNTIELTWSELKHYLQRKHCTNLEQLSHRIQKFFHYKLTITKCQNYISRIDRVMDIIIERHGDWSDC